MNLPFYLLRRFFKPGNPIALFEHLTKTYGRMAHYRAGCYRTSMAAAVCSRTNRGRAAQDYARPKYPMMFVPEPR